MNEEIIKEFGKISELIADTEHFVLNEDFLKIKNCEINFNFDFLDFCKKISLSLGIELLVEAIGQDKTSEEIYQINHKISFEGIVFKEAISFNGVVFLKNFEFVKIISRYAIEFNMCIFKYEYLELNEEHPYKVVISCIKDTPSILFQHCYFNSNTLISEMKLNKAFSMTHITIGQLTEIKRIIIESGTQAIINNDNANIILDHVEIKGDLKINDICTMLALQLSKINVLPKATCSIIDHNKAFKKTCGFGVSNLNILNSSIDGAFYIINSIFRKILFENVSVAGHIVENNFTYTKLCNIETITILKNQANKQSNLALYNKYRAKEQNYLYETSITRPLNILMDRLIGSREYFTSITIRNSLHSILAFFVSMPLALTSSESFLLWLNKYSNNFGTSWIRGIIFTVSVAFIFYYFFIITIDSPTWSCNITNWLVFDSEYWKSVIEYLWLPDGLKELKTTSDTSLWSYLWFILGKVLIAYGIYQTISAFRKYGK